MKHILYFSIGFCLLCLFCSYLFKKTPEGRKIAHEIVKGTSEEFKQKYGLRFGGVSVSAPNGIYRELGIEFDYDRKLSKSEGRYVLFDVVTSFLDRINSVDSFEKYMQEVPFTGENVTINIYIRPKDGTRIYHPDIKVFSFFNGKLRYSYDTPESEKRKGNYYLIETETLEEAKEILKH